MTITPNEQSRRRDSDRRGRHLDRAHVVLGVVAVVLLGMLTWSVFSSKDAADQAVTQTQTLAQQVSAACDAGGAAERELESIGACRQAAEATRGVVADQPAPVVQVASDEQVREAVARYLDEHPPADGRTPSQADVDAAVARYCDANACRGQDGADGTNGTDGEDGADVTDDQVAAEVAAYCAANNDCRPTQDEINEAVRVYCSAQPSPCVGPQGPEGQPGPVLPEYYTTKPNALGTGTITLHCTLRAPQDAAAPPHYDCEEVPE